MTEKRATPPPAGTHRLAINLPEAIYECLRQEAFKRRTSIKAIVVEMVEERAPV
ncbi:MAG: hypothetical protein KGL39_05765 [Patescibacteria group bacterium]|nr:hypothetical protein [Patescibacteria group bacterium]